MLTASCETDEPGATLFMILRSRRLRPTSSAQDDDQRDAGGDARRSVKEAAFKTPLESAALTSARVSRAKLPHANPLGYVIRRHWREP